MNKNQDTTKQRLLGEDNTPVLLVGKDVSNFTIFKDNCKVANSFGDWIMDEYEGPVADYNKEGSIIRESVYKNGLLEGICNVYDDYGTLLASANYHEGKEIETTIYAYPHIYSWYAEAIRGFNYSCKEVTTHQKFLYNVDLDKKASGEVEVYEGEKKIRTVKYHKGMPCKGSVTWGVVTAISCGIIIAVAGIAYIFVKLH